jgi:transcriptional regulator GlxA family with amidase domain
VAVLDVPDALRSAFALSLDVLETANRVARSASRPAPFEVLILRPGQRLPIDADAVVLPGTGAVTWNEMVKQLESKTGRWIVRMFSRAHAAGMQVATSCAGVAFAATAGILDGRRATTSWFLVPDLASRHPRIRIDAERIVVESGRCITGGAALAHADVMLTLVDRLAGPRVASLVASYLLLERKRSQGPFFVLQVLTDSEPRLRRAEAWVRAHVAERFAIADVASAVGLGERTFSRLVVRVCGMSPIKFVQRIRVDVARVLLEHGSSFDEVAPRVGYTDATALRRVFRQHGRPPRSLSPLVTNAVTSPRSRRTSHPRIEAKS